MFTLKDVAFIEMWVQDAEAVAHTYQQTYGFQRIAHAGPDAGLGGHTSVALAQGTALLLLTSPIESTGPVWDFLTVHGDGVRDIAFAVDVPEAAFDKALARGAKGTSTGPIAPKFEASRRYTIEAFGDVTHSFVRPKHWKRDALPEPYRFESAEESAGSELFTCLDHIALCVPNGELDRVADFYLDVLDFERGVEEVVETELSGMNARVVQSGSIRMPIQEPLTERPNEGPIAEFLDLNQGAGVYHIGLHTNRMIETLRALGPATHALSIPPTYYDQLLARVGELDEDLDDLRDGRVLVDRDGGGYLLQVFTKSLHPRETFFVEVVQRKGGAAGFGARNIRALFDAIEADRAIENGQRARQAISGSSPRPRLLDDR